jgi:hypothetical protein
MASDVPVSERSVGRGFQRGGEGEEGWERGGGHAPAAAGAAGAAGGGSEDGARDGEARALTVEGVASVGVSAM